VTTETLKDKKQREIVLINAITEAIKALSLALHALGIARLHTMAAPEILELDELARGKSIPKKDEQN